ncbi:MAG TPA: UDP-N-acetylmuramoyl-tripeptide--D-alanyl-D-alanine ligase [Ignavibacteriales bacterium]|nr:UDP-N-acetylmuramoyl-tripeptide--D-alanyl-D-alanine ligase [Ignavibacteriales bacterium]HOL81262.1 UDP-N-acetylmuramoyl-tripeptide--D-alanyl-D-alanine ligase [Ignavibacteriales bacterium]HOM66219.1 UDP-N-acetylmuramoyl-tripeptide--D-alanyl-D-alanine ligase [Ignavibacteriales bacterium]HPP33373.1 UDP-N-acetylmuramoyl-tripeptide--D-alanyl-D-alanine ligase [Ignavibacteriales bacterium]HRR19384.1 UDP-N-acetylmuramoyl-tripeptide--D-alanyl-D-alanine ligase [Ignavibacteriales bacterium]
MIEFNLKDLAHILKAEVFNPMYFEPFDNISTDSRIINNKSIFFAFKGEKFDGHNFVKSVSQAGVKSVVINKERISDFKNLNISIFAVDDTIKAYGELARVYRNRIKAKVIAITGSNGKTTTKELLAHILSGQYKVVKTLKNDNNHIGVPKTILSADKDTDYIVLEVGTNHPGEIEYSAKIAQPDYAYITNIGDSHLEFLKDRNGVLEEKYNLFKYTVLRAGKIIVNLDDPLIRKKTEGFIECITLSFDRKANYEGEIINIDELGIPTVRVKTYNGIIADFKSPLYGLVNGKNLFAAVSIAIELGLHVDEIQKQLDIPLSVENRMNVITKKNSIIINDYYNSNPSSMKAALEYLGFLKKYKYKMAILGDMYELGEYAIDEHKKLSYLINDSDIAHICLIGNFMKYLVSEISPVKIVNYFENRDDLIKFCHDLDINGKIILIKGSRGMKMEEFANILNKKG